MTVSLSSGNLGRINTVERPNRFLLAAELSKVAALLNVIRLAIVSIFHSLTPTELVLQSFIIVAAAFVIFFAMSMYIIYVITDNCLVVMSTYKLNRPFHRGLPLADVIGTTSRTLFRTELPVKGCKLYSYTKSQQVLYFKDNSILLLGLNASDTCDAQSGLWRFFTTLPLSVGFFAVRVGGDISAYLEKSLQDRYNSVD